MPFKKNDKNINRDGRPLSLDHKLEKVLDLMEELHFHPAKELITLYRKTKNEGLQAKILVDLLKFVEGKKADQKDPLPPKKPESPEESRKNAEKQAELIAMLEADAQKKPE